MRRQAVRDQDLPRSTALPTPVLVRLTDDPTLALARSMVLWTTAFALPIPSWNLWTAAPKPWITLGMALCSKFHSVQLKSQGQKGSSPVGSL